MEYVLTYDRVLIQSGWVENNILLFIPKGVQSMGQFLKRLRFLNYPCVVARLTWEFWCNIAWHVFAEFESDQTVYRPRKWLNRTMKAITHNNNTYITDLFRALKFQSKTRALKRRIISKLNVFILIFLSLPSHGIVCFIIMKYSQIYMNVKRESIERSKESGNLRNERKGNLICRELTQRRYS